MSMLLFLPGPRRLPWAFVLVALLCVAPSAHATTFLFSFTTTQLLSAAQSADPHWNDDGYFAIFLRPTGVTYTYDTETSPKPTPAADDWQATIAANPFGNGQELEFGKENSQSLVTVVANDTSWTNTGMSNLNVSYSDTGTPAQPVGWGTTSGRIDSRMSASSLFSFTLRGMSISPGTQVTFAGHASEIYFCTPAETSFAFTLTLTAVPEPDTIAMLGLGALLLLLAGGVRQRTRKTAAR